MNATAYHKEKESLADSIGLKEIMITALVVLGYSIMAGFYVSLIVMTVYYFEPKVKRISTDQTDQWSVTFHTIARLHLPL